MVIAAKTHFRCGELIFNLAKLVCFLVSPVAPINCVDTLQCQAIQHLVLQDQPPISPCLVSVVVSFGQVKWRSCLCSDSLVLYPMYVALSRLRGRDG